VRPRGRQCAARLPPRGAPDDGGRSATLLLVAFPLPSRSLLAGPDAAISPRPDTRTKKPSSFHPRAEPKINLNVGGHAIHFRPIAIVSRCIEFRFARC
ncbi:hypothetical protein X777_10783, partial [Ooceraea biroi]